jgi:predicted GNAT family acetyltransferase
MEVLRPGDAPSFLRLAGPLLERDEARNQLPLGIAGTLSEHPDTYDLVRFWVVVDQGAPVAAALRTEPYNLVLAEPSSRSALDALLGAIVVDDPGLPGIVGNVPHVGTAAATLSAAIGRESEVTLSQGVYGLTAVREVPRVPGTARAASTEDRELLLSWLTAFSYEALPHPDDDIARLERTLDTRFSSEGAGFWLWDHEGEPVSLAGFSGPTPTGIRVGPVYTPPEHRRRGYATTLVAALSRWLLDQGHRACFLFTDLANPTSNRIYTDIGYERVCDALEYRFRTP